MVQFASHSHPGRVHDDNEDAVGSDPIRGLWLVADGMGGHASGEVASAIVRDTIVNAVGMPLRDAVIAAHRAVADAASEGDGRYRGMGSTVVALEVHDGKGEVVWVGDSRAYLWRRQNIRRLSRDHSYVELLRESDGITEAEIRAHPHKNLVTQTLGHGDPVPSSIVVDVRQGDWLILCSDGLSDELSDDEIAELLRNSRAPDEAVVRLVDAALAKGGRDNVTVVIVAIQESDLAALWRRLAQGARTRIWLPALLGVAAALVLGSLLMFFIRNS